MSGCVAPCLNLLAAVVAMPAAILTAMAAPPAAAFAAGERRGQASGPWAPASTTVAPAPPVSGRQGLALLLETMAARGEIPAATAGQLAAEAEVLGTGPRFEGLVARARAGRPVCLTQAMQATRQWVRSRGVSLRRVPPPGDLLLQSASLPLRVYYSSDYPEAWAKAILAAAEEAWRQQVIDVGYPAPFTDGDRGPVVAGHWIYVAETGMGGGAYTEPLANVDSTVICDCSSRVVIDPLNEREFLAEIVAHEFNHATQMATDCAESISAWENFATAVEEHYFGASMAVVSFLEDFQSYPHYPIDFWTDNDYGHPSSSYQYGAALFPTFLKERHGQGDLRFLRRLWQAFAQDGVLDQFGVCSQPNHPNWFEGTDTVLRAAGSSFDEAFDEFSVWRSVTGRFDDGAHFKSGSEYRKVELASSHSLTSLPATGQVDLREYGSRHIELVPGSYRAGLAVSVSADGQASWGGSVLLWRSGRPVERLPLVFASAEGTASVPSLDGVSRAVLVVSQRQDESHNPDDMEYHTRRSFSYVISATPGVDGGLRPDAAPDRGGDRSPRDVSASDGTTRRDGGRSDGKPATDGGGDGSAGEAGCGCHLGGGQPVSRWPAALAGWLALGLALALRAGQRRRRRPAAEEQERP